MAIAHDATSNSARAGTSPLNWTHTPVGTPRGVVVLVAQNGSATDQVTAITYGGVAMTRVWDEFHSVGEAGASYVYFLGTGIPADAQTVSVTASGATTRQCVAATMTAAADTELDVANGVNGTLTNPSFVLATTAATSTCIYGCTFSGDSTSAVSPGAGLTQILETGGGGSCENFVRRTHTGGNVTVGWTWNNDRTAASGVAIREAAGGDSNPLAGVIASATTVAGVLSVTKLLAVAVASASTVTGTLQARAALAGTVSSASTVSGTLSIRSPLAGAVASASTTSGAITVQRVLAGTIASASTVSGALTNTAPGGNALAGTVISASAVAGALTVRAPLAGAVVSASTVSGTLTNTAAGTNALAGTISSVSTVSGSLLVTKPLAGAVASSSSLTGTLTSRVALAGAVASTSSMSGALIVRHPLTGQIVAASTLTGQIHVVRPLSGVIVGVSQVIAVLTNQGPVTSVGRIESSMVALFGETSRQSSVSESTSSVSVNEATSGRPALTE